MTSLYFDIRADQWPLVYDSNYNVSFCGLEKMHVFDAKKWRNIIRHLKEAKLITDNEIVKPQEAKSEHLLIVHTKKYLNSLKWSARVAIIAEVPILACIPNIMVQRAYLKPMRLQTGGSVLAGKLALERGWAINVGGGFHHCSGNHGGGFCPYADITLLIRFLVLEGYITNAMIVDLDAHQGNGYQHDFSGVSKVYIMDMYNKHIYPKDSKAKKSIRRKVELDNYVEDEEYLNKLQKIADPELLWDATGINAKIEEELLNILFCAKKRNLKAAINEFKPDILVYNAGTDVLQSDPLGLLDITDVGIIKRDQFVFETCKENNIPIVMLTSGGYLMKTAKIIADSIINLHRRGLISGL